MAAPVEPGAQRHIEYVADMVEMVMGDEDVLQGLQRDARPNHLDDDATPGVEQQGFIAYLHHRGGAGPVRIRSRSARSEGLDAHRKSRACALLHHHCSKVKPVARMIPPQAWLSRRTRSPNSEADG
ncbi:hypothetical protein D3C72_1592930 [compost metagenome]